MFAESNLPRKPTSSQLLDAIRSADTEAPSAELVQELIGFYPGHVSDI